MQVMVALAMLAFAANSLLCRFALRSELIDPASFTMIRLAAGAIVPLRSEFDIKNSTSALKKSRGQAQLR